MTCLNDLTVNYYDMALGGVDYEITNVHHHTLGFVGIDAGRGHNNAQVELIGTELHIRFTDCPTMAMPTLLAPRAVSPPKLFSVPQTGDCGCT